MHRGASDFNFCAIVFAVWGFTPGDLTVAPEASGLVCCFDSFVGYFAPRNDY